MLERQLGARLFERGRDGVRLTSRAWSPWQAPTRWPSREVVPFAELLDEPFLALPPSAGPLRDYWLALDARDGKPPRIGDEIVGAEETYEALVMAGASACWPRETLRLSSARAWWPARSEVSHRVDWRWPGGLPDRRPLLLDYVRACRQVTEVI